MDLRERLKLIYLLSSIFGILIYIVVATSGPIQTYINYNISLFHKDYNNCYFYLTLISVIIFYILISIYDFCIRK